MILQFFLSKGRYTFFIIFIDKARELDLREGSAIRNRNRVDIITGNRTK